MCSLEKWRDVSVPFDTSFPCLQHFISVFGEFKLALPTTCGGTHMRIILHDADIAATQAWAGCFNLMEKVGELMQECDVVVQMIPEDRIINSLLNLHNKTYVSNACSDSSTNECIIYTVYHTSTQITQLTTSPYMC